MKVWSKSKPIPLSQTKNWAFANFYKETQQMLAPVNATTRMSTS